MKERMKSFEREKNNLYEEIRERQAMEERLRDDFESRINEYEDTLNLKIRENDEKDRENASLKESILKLEGKIKEMNEI